MDKPFSACREMDQLVRRALEKLLSQEPFCSYDEESLVVYPIETELGQYEVRYGVGVIVPTELQPGDPDTFDSTGIKQIAVAEISMTGRRNQVVFIEEA